MSSHKKHKDSLANLMDKIGTDGSTVVLTVGHSSSNERNDQFQPTRIESIAVHALKNNFALQMPEFAFLTSRNFNNNNNNQQQQQQTMSQSQVLDPIQRMILANQNKNNDNNNFVDVMANNNYNDDSNNLFSNPLMMMMKLSSSFQNSGLPNNNNNNFQSSAIHFESCLAMCPHVPHFSSQTSTSQQQQQNQQPSKAFSFLDDESVFLRHLISYASCPSAGNLEALLNFAELCQNNNSNNKNLNNSTKKSDKTHNQFQNALLQICSVSVGLWRWSGGENSNIKSNNSTTTSMTETKNFHQARNQNNSANSNSSSSSSNPQNLDRFSVLRIQKHMNPMLCLPDCKKWLETICFVADKYEEYFSVSRSSSSSSISSSFSSSLFLLEDQSTGSPTSKFNLDDETNDEKLEERMRQHYFMSGPLRPEDFFWERILQRKPFAVLLAQLQEEQQQQQQVQKKEEETKKNSKNKSSPSLNLDEKKLKQDGAVKSETRSSSSSSSASSSSSSSFSSSSSSSSSAQIISKKSTNKSKTTTSYLSANDDKLLKLDFGLRLSDFRHQQQATATSATSTIATEYPSTELDIEFEQRQVQQIDGQEIVDEIVPFSVQEKSSSANQPLRKKFQNTPLVTDDIVFLKAADYQTVSQPCVLWFDETKMGVYNSNAAKNINQNMNNSNIGEGLLPSANEDDADDAPEKNQNRTSDYFQITTKILRRCLYEEIGSGGFSLLGRPNQRVAGIFVKEATDRAVCRLACEVLKKAATRRNLRHKTNGGLEPPKTGIVGHYDYLSNPTDKKCRLTAFAREHLAELEWAVAPLVRRLHEIYKAKAPDHFRQQDDAIPPQHRLFDTCFSTLTVNDTFRTAQHTDAGDFRSGLGIVAVIGGEWKGCHLAVPATGKAFKMEIGDVLLFDTSLPHGNTEWIPLVSDGDGNGKNRNNKKKKKNEDGDEDGNDDADGDVETVENEPPPENYSRISIVAYLRSGLMSQTCEIENQKRLLEKQKAIESVKNSTDKTGNVENVGILRQMTSAKTGNVLVDLMLANAAVSSPYSRSVKQREVSEKKSRYDNLKNQSKSYLYYYVDEDSGDRKYEFYTDPEKENTNHSSSKKKQLEQDAEVREEDANGENDETERKLSLENDEEQIVEATKTPQKINSSTKTSDANQQQQFENLTTDLPTPPLWVPPKLADALNEAQRCALVFAHQRLMKKQGSILALSMGLGKSLLALTIAFSQLVLAGGGGSGSYIPAWNYSTTTTTATTTNHLNKKSNSPRE